MAPKKIEILIAKFLVKEATSDELDELAELIKKPMNERILERYAKVHYEVTTAMSNPDVDAIKKELLKKIRRDKNPFRKIDYRRIFKYAAILIGLFMIGHVYDVSTTKSMIKKTENTLLIPDEESITLQLEDGSVQQINLEESKTIFDAEGDLVGNQKGQRLSYPKSSDREVLLYNTLSVPKGKKFEVTLSDGTRVFLNSESSLRYPVKFLDNSPREVFITGEAYFDVTREMERPFIVHSDEMEISVLGTKFNVSNYPENDNISTVLVEGSVRLGQNDGQKGSVLKPGFKAEWSRSDKDVVSMGNVDTRIYTAWIEGKLIFRNATFKHIRFTLERHYNVTIINNNKDLDAQRFDATFDVETINEILETFNISYAIDFDIVDNKAIIN